MALLKGCTHFATIFCFVVWWVFLIVFTTIDGCFAIKSYLKLCLFVWLAMITFYWIHEKFIFTLFRLYIWVWVMVRIWFFIAKILWKYFFYTFPWRNTKKFLYKYDNIIEKEPFLFMTYPFRWRSYLVILTIHSDVITLLYRDHKSHFFYVLR